jgi:8-oxo-dGTP diphosphatase
MDLTKNKIEATLVFLVRGKGNERETLLAKKVRKLIVGCVTGFGGSMNKRETPRACAKRELAKESGLLVINKKRDLEFVGVMTFHNQREDCSKFDVRVYLFLLNKWKGKLKPKKDEVADPEWHKVKGLPLKQMAVSDPFWVPLIFEGKKIKGEVWHGPNQKTMIRPPEIKVIKYLSDVD